MPEFAIIEILCVAWFTLELLTRLLCTPDRAAFMKDPLTAVDILAVLPFYCTVGLSSKQVCSGVSPEGLDRH